jgi:lipopolysaccharide export system protein LptC
MNVTVSLERGMHAWHATSGSGRERAFRVASRHSRLVRRLRMAIPIGVGGVVAFYVLASFFNPFNALSRLPSSIKLNISGTKITMEAPKLAGYTRDGRSYELTAAAAAQDLKRPHFIELKDIRAKVELQDGALINVTADAGVYDNKSEIVTLDRNVLVTASSGTEIRLIEARLDIRKGHILSERPVEVLLPNGRIDANQLEVSDNGDMVNFRGGVVVTMQGGIAPPATAGARP